MRKLPLDIQRDALNIMRDIARGNVTKRDYEYLFNLTILSNVRVTLFNKYVELHTIDNSLSYITNTNGIQTLATTYQVDPMNFQKLYNDIKIQLSVYVQMIQAIDSFIGFVQSPYTKAEEDFDQIYTSVQFNLSRIKHNI